jgi:hypothetical protein
MHRRAMLRETPATADVCPKVSIPVAGVSRCLL